MLGLEKMAIIQELWAKEVREEEREKEEQSGKDKHSISTMEGQGCATPGSMNQIGAGPRTRSASNKS